MAISRFKEGGGLRQILEILRFSVNYKSRSYKDLGTFYGIEKSFFVVE